MTRLDGHPAVCYATALPVGTGRGSSTGATITGPPVESGIGTVTLLAGRGAVPARPLLSAVPRAGHLRVATNPVPDSTGRPDRRSNRTKCRYSLRAFGFDRISLLLEAASDVWSPASQPDPGTQTFPGPAEEAHRGTG